MIGFHVSKNGRKMPDALAGDMEMLRGYGFKNICAQIFVSGPRDFRPMSAQEIDGVRVKIQQLELPVFVHGAYVDNPWTLNRASLENIAAEMQICHHIGARGLIVHLAAGAARDDVLFDVLNSLAPLPEDVKKSVVLYFEIHTAKSSAYTYETPEKISVLFTRAYKVLQENALNLRLGLCIDSAHLFACGFAMISYRDTTKWLNDVKLAIPDAPILFHLNDSASTLGSGLDKHAALTRGNIWQEFGANGGADFQDSGLYAIINWCTQNEVPLILERDPESITHDLKLLSSKI